MLVAPLPIWIVVIGYVAGGMIRGLLVALLQGTILTPLTYLGGVFASISTLPHWARALSHVNPVLYMVNAFRYGILGVSDVPVGAALGVMAIGVITLFLAAISLARAPGFRD